MDRKSLEKYYTSPATAKELAKTVESLLENAECIVEPSAGGGVWVKVCRDRFPDKKIKALDLYPESDDIEQMSWFDLKKEDVSANFVVLGNPPFSLAVEFFNHAADLGAKSIAMILPPSFCKQSVERRINLFYKKTFEKKLEHENFSFGDGFVKIGAVWQVWERCDTQRQYGKNINNSKHFSWVKTYQEADIAIRRVGGAAGRVLTPSEKLSPQSHFFIKFVDGAADRCINKELISIPCGDISRVKSLTKKEVIDYVEECIHSQVDSRANRFSHFNSNAE